METSGKILKDVPCPRRLGGCGEILCQTDDEFLIISGLLINPEY